jgi:hypothetical protein
LAVSIVLSVAQFLRKDDSAISLKISGGSTFEMSTSVVGFVILAFAMVMFFLYIEKVYQIGTLSSGVEAITPQPVPPPASADDTALSGGSGKNP